MSGNGLRDDRQFRLCPAGYFFGATDVAGIQVHLNFFAQIGEAHGPGKARGALGGMGVREDGVGCEGERP